MADKSTNSIRKSARLELHYKPWPIIGWMPEDKTPGRFRRFALELLECLKQNQLSAAVI